jgi:DNA (cytosine-5)-methyltransferase 1
LNVLDLFSGIGGFSLGLERAGMKTVAFCEIDPAAQAVLRKHWPSVPIFSDVTKLTAEDLHEPIDVICGGFPCQDISLAGKGAGLAGARSGLWFEFLRLIKETRPKYIIAENVSALRSRGLEDVLRSLNEVGYDAEWHCIPASAVGAPHQRDRIWIVAYPNASGHPPYQHGADTHRSPLIQEWQIQSLFESRGQGWWASEPAVGRMADGVPGRTHRLKQLGNAVVPQIPELIGRAILTNAS